MPMPRSRFLRRARLWAVALAAGSMTGLVSLPWMPAKPALAQRSAQQSQQPPHATAEQIAELERVVAAAEASPAASKPDPSRELQHILSMQKLATLYTQAGRFADSWPLSEKILARLERMLGPDHPNLVFALEASASGLTLQGKLDAAEKLRKRAVAINERAYGTGSLEVASSLQGLAQLMRQQERLDDALTFADRALGIARAKLPPRDQRLAIYVSQLGDIHLSAKRYEQAEPLLRQALAIADNAGETPVTGMQRIQYLQGLALALHGRGRAADAQPFVERALQTSQQMFGQDHVLTSTMLVTLALHIAEQGQLDAAEALYRRALKINERQGGLRNALADNYVGLGLVAYKRKQWREATELLRKAAAIAIAHEQAVGPSTRANSGATPHAATFLLASAAAYRTAEVTPAESTLLRNEAFVMAQRAERSQVASALAQMSARIATSSGPLAERVRERQDLAGQWRDLDRRMEAALTRPATARDAADEQRQRTHLETIAKRIGAIDTSIAHAFPEYAKLTDPAPLPIEEVQRLLADNEVMILIAHRESESLVWAVGRAGVSWLLAPMGESDIAKVVATLRCGLDDTAWSGAGAKTCATATGRPWREGEPLPFDLEAAHRLYAAFLKPFEAMTRDAHLLVVANGPLASLPLHALAVEPPAGEPIPKDAAAYATVAWLANRNPVTVLPSVASLRSLRATARPSRADRAFLGVANPLLDGPDDRYTSLAQTARQVRTCAAAASLARQAQPESRGARRALGPLPPRPTAIDSNTLRAQVPLPETAHEICTVAHDAGAGEDDIRLAERATETEVKRLSGSGALARYRILHFATHGVLAGETTGATEPGLILTPPRAATPADDGYLSASEVSELKLDADWVILSACNTAGAGRPGAEAMSGLARAFFFAQARAVLASHWQVDSQAAVALVTGASGALRSDPGIGRAEALRRAILGLIESRDNAVAAHPRYWAPFVLVGEGGAGR